MEAQIAPLEKMQRRYVSDAVQDVSGEFSRAVQAELDSRITQERESLEDAVRRAAQVSRHSAEAAQARAEELARQRVPIDRVRTSVDALAGEVGDLATAAEATA
jgi:hypothetical protein